MTCLGKKLRFGLVARVLGLATLVGGASVAEGALAGAAGGSGYSASLSNNATLRKQQLICDPAPPDLGSASITYDVTKSLLDSVQDGAGYLSRSSGTGGYIYLHDSFQNKNVLMGLNAYLNNLSDYGNDHALLATMQGLTELGYVQIFYQKLTGTPGRLTIASGYTLQQYNAGRTGTNGVDTFAAFFDSASAETAANLANYTIFAAPDNYNGFKALNSNYAADFMQVNPNAEFPNGATFTQTADQSLIGSATVAGPFVPEPATIGLIGVAALAIACRRPGRERWASSPCLE